MIVLICRVKLQVAVPIISEKQHVLIEVLKGCIHKILCCIRVAQVIISANLEFLDLTDITKGIYVKELVQIVMVFVSWSWSRHILDHLNVRFSFIDKVLNSTDSDL